MLKEINQYKDQRSDYGRIASHFEAEKRDSLSNEHPGQSQCPRVRQIKRTDGIGLQQLGTLLGVLGEGLDYILQKSTVSYMSVFFGVFKKKSFQQTAEQ